MLYHHVFSLLFFFNDTATTEIYTLSLHDALPICILIEEPRSETPYLNSLIHAVSCFPVSRLSLSAPYTAMCSKCLSFIFSQASVTASIPSGRRMALVEKFTCAPAPFQSPKIGFGAIETEIP